MSLRRRRTIGPSFPHLSTPYGASVGGGGSPSADFITRALATYPSLSSAYQGYYTTLIDGLVTDTVWAQLDALYIYATPDAALARLNLVQAPFGLTVVGTPTFTANQGYVSDGSGYLDPGFNPTISGAPGGGKFDQDSCHLSTWIYDTNTAFGCAIGAYDGVFSTILVNGAVITGYLNSGSPTSHATSSSSFGGHFISNRSGASVTEVYDNGASGTAGTPTSSALLNETMYVLARNVGGTADQFATGNISSMNSIGASLNSTQVSAFYSHLRAYMTSVGVP